MNEKYNSTDLLRVLYNFIHLLSRTPLIVHPVEQPALESDEEFADPCTQNLP